MAEAKITMDGHILDSLLLPKVLDVIVASGAEYEIEEIAIGRTRHDISHARIRIVAVEPKALAALLEQVKEHGAAEAT